MEEIGIGRKMATLIGYLGGVAVNSRISEDDIGSIPDDKIYNFAEWIKADLPPHEPLELDRFEVLRIGFLVELGRLF
jgi:hypothetical protein